MPIKALVVIDPIDILHWQKDSSLAIINAMLNDHWHVEISYPSKLWLKDFQPFAHTQRVVDLGHSAQTCTLEPVQTKELGRFDFIFIRQDPPVNDHYLFVTHVLEQAEKSGARVINRPQSLRDANEKLFTAWFRQFSAPTLVSQNHDLLRTFIEEQGCVVLKPLNQMGGTGIVKVSAGDPNTASLIAILTQDGMTPIMAQTYLPEICEGDRRILLIRGKPVPHVLVRIPHPSDFRGNMAAGGSTTLGTITPDEQIICQALEPTLEEKGLFFVGLDIIGGKITEINVTSPTGICQIEKAYPNSVTRPFLTALKQLKQH